MKEHPILFKPEMVRAILGGYKTQTRRLVERGAKYKAGDRLWVRETFADTLCGHELGYTLYKASMPMEWGDGSEKHILESKDVVWRPSIFMPRSYSRVTLEVVDKRIESLMSISDEDITQEGVTEELIGELIRPAARKYKTKKEFWISGTDESLSYCATCGNKKVSKLKKLHPENDYSLDGGYGVDGDNQPFCETCGVALENSFTDYACEYELDHFESFGFDVTSPGDCYSLCNIFDSQGWNSKLSSRIKKLSWQILWDSINLKPTPIKQNGTVRSYVSYPSSNAAFDSRYPGVRESKYSGTYKNLHIDIFSNPEVAVISFKRIS